MTELAQTNQGSISPFNQDQGAMQVPGYAGGPVTTADTVSLVAWANEMAAAGQLADSLCRTQFVPENFRGKQGDTAAAIMMGKSLGMDPLNALQNLFVVRGRPGMYARTMHSLVLRAGHEVYRAAATEQAVTVRARRRGESQWQEFTWTMDRAKKAGYVGNQKYQTDPMGMLSAKALAEACRTIAPDVLTGIAATTVEEIQLGDYEDAEVVEDTPAAVTSKRTVKRKPRGKAPEPQAPDLPPTPAPEPEADAEQGAEEGAPVMSDRAQWVQAGQLMSDLGIEDKADKAREMRDWATGQGITRDLPSMAALTRDECAAFTDYLQSLATGQPAVLEEPEDAA